MSDAAATRSSSCVWSPRGEIPSRYAFPSQWRRAPASVTDPESALCNPNAHALGYKGGAGFTLTQNRCCFAEDGRVNLYAWQVTGLRRHIVGPESHECRLPPFAGGSCSQLQRESAADAMPRRFHSASERGPRNPDTSVPELELRRA